MTIDLYKITTSLIATNKLVEYDSTATIDGDFTENNQNLTNPTILVDNSNINIFIYNYCYIIDLDRYYFIQSKEYVSGNLFRLYLKEDILSTYWNNIKNKFFFVERSTSSFNRKLVDEMLPMEYNKIVNEKEVTNGEYATTKFTSSETPKYNVILNIPLNELQNGEVYPPSITLIPNPIPNSGLNESVLGIKTNAGITSIIYLLDTNNAYYLAEQVLKNEAFLGAIKSCVVYPYEIELAPDTSDFEVLFPVFKSDGTRIKIDGLNAKAPKYALSDYLIIADFKISSEIGGIDLDSFLSQEPYLLIELFLPYSGWIRLDNILLRNDSRIIVFYINDYSSNIASVNVYDITYKRYLYTSSCQLGSKIGFTSSNLYDLSIERNNLELNAQLNSLANVLNIAMGGTGLALGNTTGIVPLMNGITGSVTTYIGLQAKLNTMHTTPVSQAISGNLSLYNPQNVRIRTTKINPTISENYYDEDFSTIKGKPLKAFEQLSTLSGFTQLSNLTDLPMVCDTLEQQQELINILESGFIIN